MDLTRENTIDINFGDIHPDRMFVLCKHKEREYLQRVERVASSRWEKAWQKLPGLNSNELEAALIDMKRERDELETIARRIKQALDNEAGHHQDDVREDVDGLLDILVAAVKSMDEP